MSYLQSNLTQPYVNAQSAIADITTGAWLQIGDGLELITFEWVFNVGAGNVTGVIYVEHTAELNNAAPSGSRVSLPLGSLHTSVSGAALASAPNPSAGVTLTAATSGRIQIMLSQVPPGQIRSWWDYGSGSGASPNTASCYVTGRRYGGR